MLDILSEYGISGEDFNPFSDNPATLIKLREIFSAQVETMKGNNGLDKEQIAKLKEEAKKNPVAIDVAGKVKSEVIDQVFNAFDECPEAMVLMVEHLEDFLSIMRYEVKEWVLNNTRPSAERVAEKKTEQERYEMAEKLQTLILSLFTMQKPYLNLTGDDFKENGGFPVKDSKLNGVVPSLPRMPDNPEKSGKKGRPLHSKNLRFAINDNPLPEGTNGNDACKLLSDSKKGVRITWRDVRKSLEAQKLDISKDSWELEFDTGKLKGWIESNTVTSSGKEVSK